MKRLLLLLLVPLLLVSCSRPHRFTKGERDDAGRWDVVPTKIKMDALLSTDFVVNEITPDKPKEDNKNE